VIVAFLCVVPGQTAGRSEYVITVPPLALLFTSWAIHEVRNRVVRGILAALFAIVCLVTLAITYRPLYVDQFVVHWGGVEVVSTMDAYGGGVAASLGVSSSPDAEKWPIEEFIDLMIDRAPVGGIRLAQADWPYNHHYMNTGNFKYSALQRGVPFQAFRINWRERPTESEITALLSQVDFLILDTEFAKRHGDEGPGIAEFLDRARSAGFAIETVTERQITPRSHLVLLQFKREGERPAFMPAEVLGDAGIRRVDVGFANGWKLLGVELDPFGQARGNVTTFWDVSAAGPDGWEIVCQLVVGEKVVRSRQALLSRPSTAVPGPTVAVRAFTFDVPKTDGSPKIRVGVRLAGSTGRPGEHSVIQRSDVPKIGRFLIELTPPADGAASRPGTRPESR
jgi:hypothetical protein